MLQAPRTTVVIPAYNHERFIGEALASLQAQTLADFEVVVVDDGSSDGTAAVAQAVAREDQRIRVVAQANRGSHAAINRGVAEARGRWVAVLNSDDRYAPTRLERLHQAADAGARFVVTDARLIDDAGREIADPEHWWNRAMADFHARVSEYGPVEGLMYGNFTVSTSNFFFERSLAEEIGPLRPLRRVLDWDWALRAALHAPSAFRYLGGERLFDYRLHGRNAILAGPLRGTLEIHRVQREALRSLERTLVAEGTYKVHGLSHKGLGAEYEMCFRCHGSGPGRRAMPTPRVHDQTNVRMQFDTGNPSFHPVAGPGTNSDVPSLSAPLAENSRASRPRSFRRCPPHRSRPTGRRRSPRRRGARRSTRG